MTDSLTCAILGCDDQTEIQGIRISGLGWIRLCAEHVVSLLASCPIAKIDIQGDRLHRHVTANAPGVGAQ